MEAKNIGGNMAIPFPGSGWTGRGKFDDIGVRSGSFVPSKSRTSHTRTDLQIDTEKMHTVEGIRQMNDEDLITLFQQGNEGVFRVLVERHQERIRNLLFSIFRESDFVEDLAQEVFIKAYQALPRFRSESSFYTWLYRIAVNKSRDEMRRRKLRRFFSLQTLDEGIQNDIQMKMSVAPENRDNEELISLGLKTLPDKFRTAVILKDIDGLSYEEIAGIMRCELGTVKSRISRGRAMLRKALKPLLEEVHV